MIVITKYEQVGQINKYGHHLPDSLIEDIQRQVGELGPNDEGHIWELHDGWRFAFDLTREDIPDPEEYCVEYVSIKEHDGVEWVDALFIENNETTVTYIFPLSIYPEYKEHADA